MKKTSLLITAAIIGGILIAAWWISKRSATKATDPWQLVGPSSTAVIETTNLAILNKLNLANPDWIKYIATRDSALIKQNASFLLAFQQAGNTTDLLLLFPQSNMPRNWTDDLLQFTRSKSKQRTYEGIGITDFIRNDSTIASVAELNGVSLVSTKAVLIEETIRQFRQQRRSFRTVQSHLFQLSSVSQDDGNLYINWSKLGKSINSDSELRQLCDAMLFDLRWSNNALLLNGFAVDTTTLRNNILSLFKEQRPVVIGIKPYIPEQFQMLTHFGMSNPVAWDQRRTTLAQTLQPGLTSQLKKWTSENGFRSDEFFKGIDNEIALCKLPSGGDVLIVELKEITKSMAQLDKLKSSLQKKGKYNRQRYATQEIHALSEPDITHSIFWPLGFHSDETYWTLNGHILVIAGNEEDMRNMIDLIESESTLNKSLQWSKFFESTLQESNVSFFLNGESPEGDYASNLFQGVRTPTRFSFQFHALENNYYSSAVLEFEQAKAKTSRRNVRRGYQLDGNASAGPWLVSNHTDKSTEVLVQDNTNKLHLLSLNGKEVWAKKINTAITSQVEQIDLLKNGKLQYLFLAGNKLYVVDRLGRDVEGYPKTLPMNDPAFMTLVDYDNTKNYRIAIANHSGEIILCDLNARALEGWSPQKVSRDLADAPRHFRIRSRDYFGAITIGGDLYVFTRRGTLNKNFPLRTGIIPGGSLFADGSNVVIVSNEGRLMRISTDGKVQDDNALLKSTTNARFQLVATSDQSDFVVVRLDQGSIAAFSAGGTQLFDKPNPASERVAVHYHRFAKGKEVIVVFDKDQRLFYALDLNGKMLIPQPLPADTMPQVYYNRTSKGLIFCVSSDASMSFVTASF